MHWVVGLSLLLTRLNDRNEVTEMSILDPRSLCDNHGLGQVDYEDIILHSPIPVSIEIVSTWEDTYHGPSNRLRVSNKSLKKGKLI